MSGRLIILRHKRWNVWNRDNIEKVKRDERLHREEIEANKLKERDTNAEHIMEMLRKGTGDREEGREEGSREVGGRDGRGEDGVIDKRDSRLLQSEQKYCAPNEEYKKEKEEKELLQKRREGSAPWALGEGSAELKKITPWYMDVSNADSRSVMVGGRKLSGDEALPAMDRDLARKAAADPMARFLDTNDAESEKRKLISQLKLSDQSLQSGGETGDASMKHNKRSKSKKKDHKDVRKSKKRKRDRSPSDKEHKLSAEEIRLLRMKRSEREKHERVKAEIILSRK